MSAEEPTFAAELEKEAAEELLRSIDALIAKAEAETKEKSRTSSGVALVATAAPFSVTNADDPTEVCAARVVTPPIPAMAKEQSQSATKKELRWEELCRERWETRLEELIEYKRENDHTNVPKSYQPNPQLARWVQNQRREYRKMQQGQPSQLTEARIDTLEELGFVWKFRQLSCWVNRLEELREYKTQHGHTNVPQRYPPNPLLGHFVKNQRAQYRRMHQGQPSYMTAERIDVMEELGFVWRVRGCDDDGDDSG